MEGLIPLVYNTIKKTKSHRRYECLSAGAAQAYSYADLDASSTGPTPAPEKMVTTFSVEHGRLQRYNSAVELSSRCYSPENKVKGPRMSKEMVGFKSHRLFTCVNGLQC
ncbi:hypothetical protein NE237_016048 [Protea cynaroides]|uniref:Uncharacterized protein n=1 Tax=Protea cynaroides TaxID=273540 RepID=A0A9Q0KF50_9MAGN|nr:hypothetical protein NE237_016048 [Protea cynaroides]